MVIFSLNSKINKFTTTLHWSLIVILFTILLPTSLPPNKLSLPYLRSTRPLLPLPKLARLSSNSSRLLQLNIHSKWPLQRLVPPQQHQNLPPKRRLPNPRQRRREQRPRKRKRPQGQQQKGKVSGIPSFSAFWANRIASRIHNFLTNFFLIIHSLLQYAILSVSKHPV